MCWYFFFWQMQQNTLSTTLSFGGGEGGGDGVLQDLEIAGRLVDKHLNYDSSFPSLLDMLRVSPQGTSSLRNWFLLIELHV